MQIGFEGWHRQEPRRAKAGKASAGVGFGFLLLVVLTALLGFWLRPRPVFELWKVEKLAPFLEAQEGDIFVRSEGDAEHFDLSGDGRPDRIAVALDRIQILGPAPEEGTREESDGDQPHGLLFDIDNDGDVDAFAWARRREGGRNDHPRSNAPSIAIFLNDGRGGFVAAAGPFVGPFERLRGQVIRDVVAGDFNRDGMLDLIVTTGDGLERVFWNRLERRRWVRLRLAPRLLAGGPIAEPEGTETRIELEAGSRIQRRWVRSERDHAAPAQTVHHFGLGEHDQIDTLRVRWPSGEESAWHEVHAGAVYRVVEGEEALRVER